MGHQGAATLLGAPRRSPAWTPERVARLGQQEIEQLRSNAGSLGEQAVVALCDEALRGRPKNCASRAATPVSNSRARHLVSRGDAFQARSVHLQDPRTSWGGVRHSDGTVVMSLWADAIESRGGSCGYLLWAPNAGGSRPWTDTPAGIERLEHCKLAIAGGGAEGLLVYGEALEGFIPEERARSVHGVDPETVLHFTVEKYGREYWASWGHKLP